MESSPFEQYATRPNHPTYPRDGNCGITIREYFAGLALQGLLSANGNAIANPSAFAVAYADQLIDELNKPQETKENNA